MERLHNYVFFSSSRGVDNVAQRKRRITMCLFCRAALSGAVEGLNVHNFSQSDVNDACLEEAKILMSLQRLIRIYASSR